MIQLSNFPNTFLLALLKKFMFLIYDSVLTRLQYNLQYKSNTW